MALIYCDSRVAGPGAGSVSDPFKAIPAITGNNTYYLARGSVFKQSVTCQSSTVNFFAYGVGPNPIIDAEGATNAFMHQYGSTINFAGIDFTNAAQVGLMLRGANAGVTISNITVASCRFYGNGTAMEYPADGTKVDAVVLTSPMTGIRYLWCESYDNQGHGFDTLGDVSVAWIGCLAERNGRTVAGHGFSLHPFHQIATSGWTLSSGSVYQRTLAAGETVGKVIDRTGGTVLARNVGAGAGVTAGQWDQSGTTLYINVSADPAGRTIQWRRLKHGPFLYQDCVANDTFTDGPTTGEGHGFAADDLSTDATYERCVALRNQGAGFQNQWGDRVTHRACVADGNWLSNFRTTGYTSDSTIDHCLTTRSRQHGILFSAPHTGTLVRNTIACFNGQDATGMHGIICLTTNGTGQNNLVFNNGINNSGSIVNVSATGHVVADPMFVNSDRPWLGLRAGSPAWGSGIPIQGAKDRYNRRYSIPPNIGPWAVQSR